MLALYCLIVKICGIMAEKKVKTVKMGNQKKDVANLEQQRKLSYEELEKVAGQLNDKCRRLYNQLMEAQQVIAGVNEIGMLLEVISKSEYFSGEFVDRCGKKIESLVTKLLDAEEGVKTEEK